LARAGCALVAAALLTLSAGAPLSAQPAPPAGAPSAEEMARTLGQGMGVTTDSLLEARTREVSKGLRCPVCRGESIQDSPAELAGQMRNVVREQLAAGQSAEQVQRYFTEKYGEWILLAPKAEGVNLLVYLLPAAFVVAGAGLVWVAAKKWVRPAATEAPRG
jgi:cytochrome c-type biogenesis protein CcmH/NrfF